MADDKIVKSTREELEYRHKVTEDMLARGADLKVIKQTLAKKFDVGEPTVRKYIRDVFIKWDGQLHENRPYLRGAARTRLNHLYERCLIEKRYNVCVTIIDRLCRLDALDQPQTEYLEVNHTTAVISLTPIQRQERLHELQLKGAFNIGKKEMKLLELASARQLPLSGEVEKEKD